jgi:hypothetical protein
MANICTTQCGTMTCSSNSMGNTVCDLPNNRCVQCLSDGDCSSQTTNKTCDLRPNMQGLPTGRCIGCLDNSQCAAGSVCIGNACIGKCATDRDCSADGGGQTPRCNPTTNTCVQCISDAQCTPPATCNTRGSCGGGVVMDAGRGGGDAGGTPPQDSGGGTPPTQDSGGGTPPTQDSGGGGGG